MKCMICQQAKGKRGCLLHDKQLICSRCCAEVRNQGCAGCSYYDEAEKFTVEKIKKSGKPREFTVRIYPAVDQVVDDALVLFNQGRKTESEAKLRELVAQHPDIYTTHFGLGSILGMQGKFDEALACLDRCLQIFPLYAPAWYNKGGAHAQKGELLQMVEAFQKAVEYGDPKENFVQDAKQNLREFDRIEREQGSSLENWIRSLRFFEAGHKQMMTGQYEAAIENLLKAAEACPHIPSAFGNLGLCYGFLGQKQKALEAFDRALEVEPDYELALINRIIVEKLEEGEKLHGNLRSTKYHLEYGELTGRSYAEDLLAQALSRKAR